MRSMFSVVTPRIWVSPRSNSAEPCTRGRTSTSADERADVGERRGRRCGPCRAGRAGGPASWSASGRRRRSPSRGPRTAGASFSTASALTRSSSASRSCLPAMVSAAASGSDDGGRDGLEDVVLVVQEERELAGRLGGLRGERLLGLAQHRDERLGGLEALRRRPPRSAPSAPLRDELDRAASVASASTIMIATSPSSTTRPATTMSKTAVLELAVRREGDPLAARSARRGCRRSGRRTAGRRAGWTARRR